jgi:hypothetical protein
VGLSAWRTCPSVIARSERDRSDIGYSTSHSRSLCFVVVWLQVDMQNGDGNGIAGSRDRSWECFTPAGLRVLVVDDDKTCLRVISKMLEQCNYEGNCFPITLLRRVTYTGRSFKRNQYITTKYNVQALHVLCIFRLAGVAPANLHCCCGACYLTI